MHKKIILPLTIFALVLFAGGLFVAKAQTASSGASPIVGWAWSSNIGWISFGSSTPGAGAGSYGVYVKPGGDFDGYAWSSNVGWISFSGADLSGCLGSATQAHISTSTGSVTGWVRAISGVGRTDGWDGCIELSGTNHPTSVSNGTGGISYNSTTQGLVGYAWDSGALGWLNFSPMVNIPGNPTTTPVTCTGNCGGGPSGPTLVCNSINFTVNSGNPVTAPATLNIYVNGSGSYVYTFTPGDGSGSISNATGQFSHTYPNANTASSITYSPTVTVSGTPTPSSSSCPLSSVTLPAASQNNTPAGPLSLSLNVSNSAPIFGQYLRIPTGTNFDLAWNVDLSYATSTCVGTITPPNTAIPGSWLNSVNGLSNTGTGQYKVVTNNGTSTTNITDTTDDVGTYIFSLKCNTKSDGSGTWTATTSTLRLTDSNIGEF